MMSIRSALIRAALATGCCAPLGQAAVGQTAAAAYPTKTVTIVDLFGAGGVADIEARRLAPVLEKALGKPVVIENKPGAAGMIGIEYTARSAADGHTIVWATASVPAYKVLFKDLRIDPVKDLAPISLTVDFPSGFIVNSQVPFKTIEELVAYAKANPGTLNYGSFGRTTTMMVMEAFAKNTGIKVTSIPFSTYGQMITGLQRNDIQLLQTPYNFSLKGQVDSGQFRALLKIGNTRSRALPDVPTAVEKGWTVPDNGWQGLMAPAGTPKPVIDRLAVEVARYIASPETQKRGQETGNEMLSNTPEQFRQLIDNDARYWSDLAASIGLKPE
jgi:tripartite-type tricarboxylate transporter receptor subunit TctC